MMRKLLFFFKKIRNKQALFDYLIIIYCSAEVGNQRYNNNWNSKLYIAVFNNKNNIKVLRLLFYDEIIILLTLDNYKY